MLKPSSGRNKGRQGLAWGKGTKRLVRKIEKLGYELRHENSNLTMTFVGHCPPYEKKISPILHAIENNRDAVIEYLKFVEALRASREGDEKSEPISENESGAETQCSEYDGGRAESCDKGSNDEPLRCFGFFKRGKCAIDR